MIPFIDLEGGFLSDEELLFLAGASGGGGVEHTIINNPATFTTDMAKPLRRLLIPFTPVQSGTGDPSPDNIRPITGWAGLNIYRTGVNAFDGVLEQGALDGNGGNTPSTSNYRSKNFIPVIPGGKYRPVFARAGLGSNMNVFYYYKDKTRKRDAWASAASTITIDADVYFVRFYMDTAWSAATDRTIGFNYSATATEFEPYSGTTIPVSWQTEAGTVYGGTLDALTGVLTVTHIQKAFKKSAYGPEAAGQAIPYRQIANAPRDIAPISGVDWAKAKQTQIMNCGKIANPYSESAYGNYVGVVFWQATTGTVFRISAPLYDALSESDEIVYCYELETPQTIQLDPVSLSTLIGDNVLWTDTNGDNTIVYLKKT